MKKSFYFYTSIALLIILGLVIGNYIFGWTIPTANPPLSNLPRPIDTGSSKQPKEGYLAIGTTTTPAYPLEVVGTMQVWGQLISKVASGTAPLVVTSPTKVANLNVDLLDGYDSSDLLGGGTVWGFSAPPGNCAPYNDCDGDGKTAFTGDCDESCPTCFVGSTANPTSPDGKDQDCDGTIDENDGVLCTASYSSTATKFGYNSSCVWAYNEAYPYSSAGTPPPTDTSHCVADGTTCTAWSGGWTNCTSNSTTIALDIASTITCGGTTWYDRAGTQSDPSGSYFKCKQMTGCTKTNYYH